MHYPANKYCGNQLRYPLDRDYEVDRAIYLGLGLGDVGSLTRQQITTHQTIAYIFTLSKNGQTITACLLATLNLFTDPL